MGNGINDVSTLQLSRPRPVSALRHWPIIKKTILKYIMLLEKEEESQILFGTIVIGTMIIDLLISWSLKY